MFWIAWPAAPLPRLSIAETTTARRSANAARVDEGVVRAGRLLRGRAAHRSRGRTARRRTHRAGCVASAASSRSSRQRQVAGRQDAARLRHEVRHEGHRHRRSRVGKALLDLGPMPMAAEPVRPGRLGQLGEQVVGAGAAPRAADARLGVDDRRRRRCSAGSARTARAPAAPRSGSSPGWRSASRRRSASRLHSVSP